MMEQIWKYCTMQPISKKGDPDKDVFLLPAGQICDSRYTSKWLVIYGLDLVNDPTSFHEDYRNKILQKLSNRSYWIDSSDDTEMYVNKDRILECDIKNYLRLWLMYKGHKVAGIVESNMREFSDSTPDIESVEDLAKEIKEWVKRLNAGDI